jgi:hypothetical protein
MIYYLYARHLAAFAFPWSKEVREGSRFLSLSNDFRIDQFTPTTTALLVQIVSIQRSPCCPWCGQSSQQIHSRSERIVADGIVNLSKN